MVDGGRTGAVSSEPVWSALAGLFTGTLPIDGVSISVVGFAGMESVISSSSALASKLELMQFELGEGPHFEALSTAQPVLIPEMSAADAQRWPVFAHQVNALNVGAMFCLPMVLGAALVGVVDLHRKHAGALTSGDVQKAMALTRTVTRTAVQEATDAANNDDRRSGPFPEMRREVHQATGMLVVQLNTTATNALATLRAHAYALGRAVEDVAADVVHRRVDLTEPFR